VGLVANIYTITIGATSHAPRIIMNIAMRSAPNTAGRTVSGKPSTQLPKRTVRDCFSVIALMVMAT
jgi:hypothetical protein